MVTKKPPPILKEDPNTADAANAYEMLCGNTPPPIHNKPPAAVKPDTALVTLINGVCKAGVTLHTD